jgi:hypothetical protein
MEVSLDIGAEITAKIDAAADKLEKAADGFRQMQEALSHTPADITFQASGVGVATTSLILNCTGPSIGRVWQVRRLSIFTTGSPSGFKCWFYTSGTKPSLHQPTTIAAYITSSPSVTYYSTHQFVLNQNETLWCIVTGLSAGQVFTATGRAEDYDFAAYRTVATI